jgi:DNA-binding MarR family transcriptional regulator
LRKKGMIALNADEADNRIKYVTSTPTAMKYFAKLSECIDKAHSA